MATKEEQQQLMEHLKFTPRTYKISLWGYGGEKVMGSVDPKVWDYCVANQVDLVDLAWDSNAAENMGLDEDMLPFPPGSWYECSDMVHTNGVSRDAGTIQIEDETGETVFERSLEDCDGCEDSPGWSCQEEVWVGMGKKAGDVVFIGSSNEKGTFFEGEIELRAPFNIELLELHYDEVDGEELVNRVYYDGEEIDNWGGGTDGKSSNMDMVRITDDEGNWEKYDPGEKDWGEPPMGPSPSDWEQSVKFKFDQHRPVYKGWYSVNYGYGSTFGYLYWDGENFGDFEYGKFYPRDLDSIVTWQGYNWDTTSWSNQPPEPPAVKCKSCGWTGNRDELKEDDDYNNFCPECNANDKKLEWLDYDPESKKGLANRKKYCKPWDPAVALEQIAVPDDFSFEDGVAALEQALQELGQQIGADPEELAPKKKKRK